MYAEQRRKKTGGGREADYEKAVGYYLEQCGYEILQYNYRCRAGEIDIVAKDGPYLVFCEVKYRSGAGKGSPLEAVDGRKQSRLYRSAVYYLAEHGLDGVPCRFDVAGIEGTDNHNILKMRLPEERRECNEGAGTEL